MKPYGCPRGAFSLVESQIVILVVCAPNPENLGTNDMNTALTTTSPTSSTTMSSREIAELTGKRHGHVLFDIRNMLNELGLGSPEFSGTYVHPQNGQAYACFHLPKDLTITLISGYNVTMRHRIVTRWQELEAAPKAVALPQNFGEALRAMLDGIDRHCG